MMSWPAALALALLLDVASHIVDADAADTSQAEDARFLIQATFGPTRQSIRALGRDASYQEWMRKQMRPFMLSSHREHFRKRVNPPYDSPMMPAFRASHQCEKGSRWVSYAFTRAQEKMAVSIAAKIRVAGKVVSDIDPSGQGNGISQMSCTNAVMPDWRHTCTQRKRYVLPRCQDKPDDWAASTVCQQSCFDYGFPYEGDDCSGGWPQLGRDRFEGYACQVQEGVGGLVALSTKEDCKEVIYVRNPAIWQADRNTLIELPATSLIASPALPGPRFLMETMSSPNCDWHDSTLVSSGDSLLRFEPRMVLEDNTPESPALLHGSTCIARNFLNEGTCQVLSQAQQVDTGCFQACGSFGEVANDATKGYQIAMLTPANTRGSSRLDNSYGGNQPAPLGKTATWTELVLSSEDQLRQRMAWALSQIYVVGVTNKANEQYLAYYDIFIKHAFGSLRDLLREVIYSPVMGNYLTYRGSRSFDQSRSFADENFAREVMQLFTIGLTMLNKNGSAVLSNEEEVPTYGNEQIMNFARVFTGLNWVPPRDNIERTSGNMIDPMQMTGRFHDRYPKPDLHGGFLGDGFPLCRELPRRAFLARGARYEFLGYSHQGHAVELSPASGLFQALCREREGSCAFEAVVTLPRNDLFCHETECDVSSMTIVKVEGGFYEYIAPPCVFTFFYKGRQAARPQSWRNKEVCVDPLLPLAGVACCAGGGASGGAPLLCSNNPTDHMKRKGITCANRPNFMSTKSCNKKESWRNKKWCQHECFKLGRGYAGDNCAPAEGDEPQEELACSAPTHRMTFEAAESRCNAARLSICEDKKSECDASMYVWKPRGEFCRSALTVYADGKVSAYTEHVENRFAVPWSGPAAPAGTYDATLVEVEAFSGSTLPSASEVTSDLKVGAFERAGTHDAEEHGVKAYGPVAPMDLTTVFECEGKFYQNIRSMVEVEGDDGTTFTFRNPPAFIRPDLVEMGDGELNRAAMAEVESLLDHLVYHPNTGTFIGKKLAQRFVTSNPSAEYLTGITEAFESGTYGGVTYGEHGSLGATLAAILLHPEARGEGKRAETTGLLREPMLKIIHFMRSMEYTDDLAEYVSFAQIDEIIGQFPYHSPTVFNFYDAEYMPSRFASEPEPESESEPEAEAVAPEFQIFTPPFALGLLNGMASLLRDGVTSCGDGFGIRWRSGGNCQRGTLGFSASSEEETLSDLDLLLTGGRLTPDNAAVVKAAYDHPPADVGGPLQAAQQAILFTPEFHNLGEPLPSGRRPASVQPAEPQFKDYKAVVMLFLAGGADTFHMLVPINCPLWNQYKEIRGDGAHSSDTELRPIRSNNDANCRNFGIHPEMQFIAELYNRDNAPAAFVANIGALVEPLNRSTLKDSGKKKCAGLFSHSHQQKAAQTLQCQTPGAAPKGVGGRMADVLAEKYKVESFSISGTATWSEGFDTQTEIISGTKGVVRLSNYDLWGNFISNITRQTHGNVYCEEYAEAFADAIASSEKLGREIEGIDLDGYGLDTGLQKQLYQVARLIKAHPARKAERDFFFVQTGGWDHHSGLLEGFALNMREVDGAIRGFVEELEQQGNFDKTVLMTASDFGRTMTFNGMGTDHGWGGNHFIIGGSIQGGQIFNRFPTSFDIATSEYLTDRGRVIPEYPWENMMVPVAKWMGVKDPDPVDVVFPNLDNFQDEHIIPCTSLFSEGCA